MRSSNMRQRHPTDLAREPAIAQVAASPPLKKARAYVVPRVSVLVVVYACFIALVAVTVVYFHTWLPPPRALDAPREVFSEARARQTLERIMSFGYHPVGSRANDVLIPRYLLQQIEDIKQHAAADVRIEVEVQKPSGAFGLAFLTQFHNVYANITNLLVRVSSTSPAAASDVLNNSLLLSAHYDAAVGGAAASDDGVNIAIMMELLRMYSLNPPLHGSLIFNFNGAEETIMQASHGFITQHDWANSIRAFINMEAAGAGGRELLFQTGSDELALAYAEGAKYPHASIIAQELFQSGVIPADTDYRVYRDYGAIAGMDFAYVANGYVYHTSLDDISRIQQGAVQRFGDNVDGIIQRLANIPGRLAKVASTPQRPHTMFVDLLGLTMISMDKDTLMALCWGVLVVAMLYMMVSRITFRERMASIGLLGKCLGLGFAASMCVAAIMMVFAPMSWFSLPPLGAVLYITPALAASAHCLAKFVERLPSRSPEVLWRLEECLFEAMMLCWVVALMLLLSLKSMSSYITALWVFFALVGQGLSHLFRRLQWLSSKLYVTIAIGAIVIPVVHTAFVFVILLLFFIPLFGRAGTTVPADFVVAVIFTLCLWVMTSFSCRFFCFVPVKQLHHIRNALLALSVLVIIVATSVNPYTEVTPKRLVIQHMQRDIQLPNGDIQAGDSGIWVNAFDCRELSPIKHVLAKTRWEDPALVTPPAHIMDQLEIYGEVPWYLPIHHMFPESKSWYLHATPPKLSKGVAPTTLDVLSTRVDEATGHRTVHLRLVGPSHLNIFIDATKTKLASWSMGNGTDGPITTMQGDTYVLAFNTGLPPATFNLWLEAETSDPIEMVVVGHYLEEVTPEIRELLQALPPWVVSAHFVSTWASRIV